MDKTKTLVLLFLMASSLASRGQDTIQPRYQAVFGDSITLWYIFNGVYGFEYSGTDVQQTIMDDTTTINDTVYMILRSRDDLSAMPIFNINYYQSQCIRESRDHSKLYFKQNRYHINTPEILIMDLDLNIGDTLDTHNWSAIESSNYPNIPTITIDTIYSQNGKKIMQTDFRVYVREEAWWDTLFFIEGVGPSLGLYYPKLRDDYATLICHFKDGEQNCHGAMYSHFEEFEETCVIWFDPGRIEEPSKTVCHIAYPNPTRGVFEIRFPKVSDYKVIISSVTGQIVQTKTIYGDKVFVNIQNHPRGTYFIKITDANNATKVAKVIKI